MHHYITKYDENGKKYAERWIQLNLLGWAICFSKRIIRLYKRQLQKAVFYNTYFTVPPG